MTEEDLGGTETFLGTETADRPKQVYVVDDNSDVRRSLHFSLSAIDIVSWPFSCAQDLLDEAASLPPAPLLLDIKMPGIDGLEALTLLREQGIGWPVIMMSAHGDIKMAVKSIKLGAVDFLEKPFKFEQLEVLLQGAYEHLSRAPKVKISVERAETLLARLSPRESEVMLLLVKGASNKGVATELGLSDRTVEVHRAKALTKLGVKSVVESVQIMLASRGQAL